MTKITIKNKDKQLAVNLMYGFSAIIGVFFCILIAITSILVPSFIWSKIIFGVGAVLMSVAIGFTYLKKYNLAKYLIILAPPYILLVVSLVFKSHGILSNVFTYLIPRVFCILFLMAPIIFFGLKQSKRMIISFIVLSPTIFLFDYLHRLIGVNIETLPYEPKFYFGFLILFICVYILPLISLLFTQKANILFREKVKKQNIEIKQEVEKTKTLNTKLQFQANLYTVLDVVSQDISLTEIFEKILDTLFEIETIDIEKKGLVFLKDEEGFLKLNAHRNVGVLKTMCATVNPGQCLCGKAMLQKETLFCNSVTHDHTTQPEGMQPHGHYVLPIKHGETVLGILCLYIKEGAEKDIDTLNYLETVATILANKINKEYQKDQLESVMKQLVTSESKYRDMIENSNDIIYQSNYNGDFIYANKVTQELTGYSIDEFLTFNYVDIIVEEHKKRVVKFYADNLKETISDIKNYIEFPMICKNGTIKWIGQRVSVVFDDNSKKRIKYFQSIARDITAIKITEEKLQKSESNFKQISNTIDDTFYLYNIVEKKYEYISPNCEKVLGVNQEIFYSGGDLHGLSVYKEDKALFKEATIKVDNGEPYDIEYRIIINDTIRWIREQSFPIKDSEGTTIKNSGICSDITVEKEVENKIKKLLEELQLKEDTLLKITESQHLVFWLSTWGTDDLDYISPSYEQLFERSVESIINNSNSWYENIHPEDKERVKQAYLEKVPKGTYDIEFRLLFKDGRIKWIRERAFPVEQVGDGFGKVSGLSEDITHKKLIEKELAKSHKKTAELVVITTELNESLEEKVEVRTKEVVLQKTMLEKNYATAKILAQVGLDISSSLKFDEIFNKLYQNVNKLLDAEVFGVRVYNKEENIIEYKYGIESDVKLEIIEVPFSDKNNYTVWCIENNKEILINDNEKEYKNYVSEIKVPSGKMPHSLIFCPMVVGNTVLGAITVQSFEKNAYTENDMDIIRTLSFYTGIALANAKLYETLEFKVAARTLELFRKNKEITDSINYAKRIQDAMLRGEEDRKKFLEDSFVLYEPKDILSGDFYRVDELKTKKGDELVFFTVGDCTGHGVPGASLAMLCNSILKHSTTNPNVNSSGEALDYAKEQLGLFFHSSDGKMIDDGMDTAFCTLNKKTKMLYFAGANSNCIIIRKKEVIILKGDRRHVGYQEDETLFTDHTFKLEKNDCIYLTSDGIIDQFGGPNNRKFMRKRFFELLQREHSNSMKIQGENIKKAFENWKGETEQTDDVCVMGVRIT